VAEEGAKSRASPFQNSDGPFWWPNALTPSHPHVPHHDVFQTLFPHFPTGISLSSPIHLSSIPFSGGMPERIYTNNEAQIPIQSPKRAQTSDMTKTRPAKNSWEYNIKTGITGGLAGCVVGISLHSGPFHN
jgi:hypothetical protein